MTVRQRLLQLIYPLFRLFRKFSGEGKVLANKSSVHPPVSFYSLSVNLNNGTPFSFEQLRGKKVLLVNTASNCVYTGQYAELQKLYLQRKEQLQIIGFPANDFKEQEKGGDEEIANFCQVNFGVTFPLVRKSSVVEGPQQNRVFQWLTRKEENGWNAQKPRWNFSKYLVNEEGVLTHYFDPAISPLSDEVMGAVRNVNGQS